VEALQCFALAAEYRDDDTTSTPGASATSAARIGDGDEFVERLRLAARLHDVGKLSMLEAILRRRGRLTADERRVMKTHTTNGAAILAGSAFPVLSLGEQIALTHPERWDGSGCPSRLGGEAFRLAGRIVAVADVFDAPTSARSNQPGRARRP